MPAAPENRLVPEAGRYVQVVKTFCVSSPDPVTNSCSFVFLAAACDPDNPGPWRSRVIDTGAFAPGLLTILED